MVSGGSAMCSSAMSQSILSTPTPVLLNFAPSLMYIAATSKVGQYQHIMYSIKSSYFIRMTTRSVSIPQHRAARHKKSLTLVLSSRYLGGAHRPQAGMCTILHRNTFLYKLNQVMILSYILSHRMPPSAYSSLCWMLLIISNYMLLLTSTRRYPFRL